MIALDTSLYGKAIIYSKGNNVFSINESDSEYTVTVTAKKTESHSRNQNIIDRKQRLEVLNLIGTYILFSQYSSEHNLGDEYFIVYAKGLDFHYMADVHNLKNETSFLSGSKSIRYSINKKDYNITSATFRQNIDLYRLLAENYRNNKCMESAMLLYNYYSISVQTYNQLERDFLEGNSALPPEIRMLHNFSGRLEQSVYYNNDNSENIDKCIEEVLKSTTKYTIPYLTFSLVDLVTSASLREKPFFFKKWKESLSGSLWEDVLRFVCENHVYKLPSDPTITEIVEAYPGAISPQGLQIAINEPKYLEGAKYYSQSDFENARAALEESLDIDGFSAKCLNLLGASYRFLNEPERALPYLLLCMKMDPETPYLVGNIVLCMDGIKYPKIKELSKALSYYAKDLWSKEIIDNYINN